MITDAKSRNGAGKDEAERLRAKAAALREEAAFCRKLGARRAAADVASRASCLERDAEVLEEDAGERFRPA